MTEAYFTNPLIFLIKTLFGLYITLVVIRFLLQWARADFYNPISQFVVKLTSPVLRPLRKVIPGFRGLDIASLVLAWLLQALELMLLAMLFGLGLRPLAALAWAIPALFGLVISIFLFAILIRVILSWVSPDPYNPAIDLLNRLTDPILVPAQRLLPPISGIDLSPMVAMVGLVLLQMLLLPPLRALTGSPF
ncbi:MAG: YggT family protein [Thiohalocapsa sp.]|uniref:YggT family protein n=1 Tax=Thiohalocapsa sp. TaxID=2497641 RepID=UPI0025D72116|nr:YggT family protein [Thiohalocapsa sp.]MCG6941899.1 YggT family protein [Thiohalocapsa sp.]